jgi:hypothetical protein
MVTEATGQLAERESLMTLEQYFKSECAKGALDFALRATVFAGVVELYVHPANRDGDTTPPLIVEGDRVRPKFTPVDGVVAGAAARAAAIAETEAALADTVDALDSRKHGEV